MVSRVYPEIEPYEHGMLDVGDGNLVYWEVCGNPEGKPVVGLHGGPGTGCSPVMRRRFDPSLYRIVLFDQRGSGRSLPHAADHGTDLSVNTTAHLVRDIELLREHLGVERWMVFGGSWGCTLGLHYAESFPERVTEIVMVAITSGRYSELEWLYGGLGRFFPEEYDRFRRGAPEGSVDLVAAYDALLNDADPAVRQKAADDWCAWEGSIVSMDPDHTPAPRESDPRWRHAFARITAHYFRHFAWLEDGQVLRDIGRLHGIPAVLVHGRLDMQGPLHTAWELDRAWPDAELVVVHGAAHSVQDGGMMEAILAATDKFARR
ncbi:prolyl aminopeptidase [Saccharothrix espanaensis]|uniref:Proline iminopeptidase n=1 Tax=Saccharothrix espanaensis (strain ATCC 51144 / DSM 44229 / JCM 9112 / NBRC 15066 / NRRL 15764) TaxID=1179773 RepID=K0K1Y3_SACES|nr:putative proline iminopeptidase [Saccharothrix espanaensis DSM 44229]